DFSVRTTAPFTVGPVDMINNICPGDELGSLAVTDITGTPPFSIQWTAEDGALVSTEPTASMLANGTYTLRVDDAGGCTFTEDYAIISPPLPTINVVTEDERCENGEGAILIELSTTANIELLLNNQPIAPSDLTGLSQGAYPISVFTSNNCLIVDTVLQIQNLTPVELSGDTSITVFKGRPTTIELMDLPDVPLVYEWFPASDLSCTDCATPLLITEDDQQYTVNITDPASGCSGIYTVNIITRPQEKVFIPNAFSPNDDGFNDRFEVFPSDEEVVLTNMKVFDRWGALVFNSDQPDAAWDGIFNGQALGVGVYVYMITIQKSTGSELLSGDVLLVR
ncbi:MAG: gliding motility-associated C-terminal domain-containing protein, partial [Bacteroidota bacterium]